MSDVRAFAHRLTQLEKRFGGFVTQLPINVWSVHAPTPTLPWLQGGDRMAHHGYARRYARALAGRQTDPLVLVEVGILQGTGLATWCAALPEATVIGLDIDVQRFLDQRGNLRALGAFARNEPEAYPYDQLAPGDPQRFLADRQVDVYIDDGLHTAEAIESSLRAFVPHLSASCVGFIEDNPQAAPVVTAVLGPDWTVKAHGELTVFTRRTE